MTTDRSKSAPGDAEPPNDPTRPAEVGGPSPSTAGNAQAAPSDDEAGDTAQVPQPKDGATPRRRMSAADRRDQLLDVARDIVAAEGFAAVTIDRVARAARVARALVYQQFTDLSGLTTALLERESAIAFAGVRTLDWDVTDAEGIGRGMLAYLHAAPTSWRIMLSPSGGGPPELRERIAVGQEYARMIEARHLSRFTGVAVDPNGPTQRLLLAALEELIRLHLADPDAYPDEMVVDYVRSLTEWAMQVEKTRRPAE